MNYFRKIYTLIFKPIIASVVGYRSSCRFIPTCSVYSQKAIRRHGIIFGGWLSAVRFLKCNPLFKGGLDPVPK